MRDGDSDVRRLSLSDFLFHNMLYLILICRAIGDVVVEVALSLVYICQFRVQAASRNRRRRRQPKLTSTLPTTWLTTHNTSSCVPMGPRGKMDSMVQDWLQFMPGTLTRTRNRASKNMSRSTVQSYTACFRQQTMLEGGRPWQGPRDMVGDTWS